MEESWGTREFNECGVEDKREAKSLAAMADRLLEHPELAFSSAVGQGLRKAAWRIFSKEEVDVSCGHYRQTARRCQEYEVGLVSQKLWAPVAIGRPAHPRKYPLEEQENYCWVEALGWVGQYLSGVKQVVLVLDRDSDFYEYFSSPRPANVELLLWAHHLQRYVYLAGERMRLGAVSFTNTVPVSVFLAKTKQRKERTARLEVSWGQVVCPPASDKKGEQVALWLVKAIEAAPPAGEEPVDGICSPPSE